MGRDAGRLSGKAVGKALSRAKGQNNGSSERQGSGLPSSMSPSLLIRDKGGPACRSSYSIRTVGCSLLLQLVNFSLSNSVCCFSIVTSALGHVATEGSVMRGSTSLNINKPTHESHMIQRGLRLLLYTAASSIGEQQAEWINAVSCLGLAVNFAG